MKKIICDEIMNLLTVITGLFGKISALLSTFWGWIITFGVAISTYFFDIHTLIYIVFALVLIDFFLGIITTVIHKGKHSIESKKISKSAVKLLVYVGSLMILFAGEKELGFYDGFLFSKIVFALITLTELWSSVSMVLLINPNIPFLRIFQSFIIKELANKLNKTEDEVKEILNEKKK